MKKTILGQLYWQNALLLLFFIGCSTVSVVAQTITGKVTSVKGETLPGVNIVIKGTTKGTTTDKDGQYSIDVRKNQTLIFSFLGYQLQEIAVGDQTQLNVTLQDAAESLEEVVVTAENRSVSAQRVPITLDLVRGKDIQKQGVADLLQLQNIAPSLNIVQNTIFNQVNIRGVGSNDGAAELSDQAVTIGIDGEFINRPVALNAAMFDLDRVEVLKGPQGTLYGRNATAGSVNIIAKKPTNSREVNIGASYGNYNYLKLNGAVNLPLGKIAAIRVAGMLDKHDGFRDGGALVGRVDNGNVWALRAGLDINPTKNLNIYLVGEMNKTDQQAPSQYGVRLIGLPGLNGTIPSNFTTDLPKDFPLASAGFMKVDQKAVRTKVSYNLGSASITYTGAYRVVDLDGYQSLNGFVPETFAFHNDLSYKTSNHELRMNGETAKLTWQVGGFYGNEDSDVRRGLILHVLRANFNNQSPFNSFFFRDVNSKTSAVFGQATYNFSEKTGLTVGLRNTTDVKTREGSDLAAGPMPPNADRVRFFYPNVPTSIDQAGMRRLTGVPNEGRWNQTTWTIGMEHKIDANKFLFAKVSKGYKAGGFDNVGEYDPEKLIAYEIGSKNKFADNRLKLNASAFYYDYTNQQVSVFISTAVGAAIKNAGSSRVFGIETEGEYAISKNDRFKWTINYLDAQIKDLKVFTSVLVNVATPADVDLSGNRPIQAPKWTMTARYDHDFKIGGGTLNAGIQTLFKSEYFLQPFNFAMDRQPSYTKTDVNLTYTSKSGKYDIGVYAQNLEDNRILTYAAWNGGTIGIYNWIFGTPRLVGAQLNVRL